MRSAIGVGVLAALLAAACARKGPAAPAPDVGLPELIQSPLKALPKLSDLRGKVVVLDFWATWCPTCVETMPHMNKMAEKFKDRPVVFLSVTDEDRATIERFLTTHPVTPWIGRDPDDRMFRAFGVRGIPQTFVIDPYGRVSLKISPSWLYASDIEDALKAAPPAPAAGKAG